MDGPIFGLRFGSNEDIHPTLEDLRVFLESPKREGRKERHADDLAKYLDQLKQLDDFSVRQKQGAAQPDFAEKMVFGVLSHSRFFQPPLKSAIELYKYHCKNLSLIDFRKPQSFIKSAEEEIGRLNPKKKDDQAKIARLRGLIDQRTGDLETLKTRWLELGKELRGIAVYVRDNLLRIRKLCESSIAILVELQISGEKKGQLIEDIKTHFKDRVRDHLQIGPVTKQFIEELKVEVERLSQQLSKQVLEDIYFMTRVYEDIHEHAKKTADRLDGLIRRIETKRQANLDEDRDLFGRVEEALISLITDFRFPTKAPEAPADSGERDNILAGKRNEMLNHLFALLQKGSGG